MVTGLTDSSAQVADVDIDAAYWVAFRNVSGVGPVRFQRLLQMVGSMRGAWEADSRQLSDILDRRTLEQLTAHCRKVDPVAEYRELQDLNIQVITLSEDRYPDLLREIPAPPPVIFVRGEMNPNDRRAVAIVGTRRLT